MSSEFVSGNDGDVQVDGVSIAGLTKWEMTKTTKEVTLLHFQSETDSDDNVWEDSLVGTSSAKVSFEGHIDTNSTTATDSGTPGLSNGLVVTMNLILVKDTPWGFADVSVQITEVVIGTAIDSDKPAPFKGTGKVKGSPGKTGTIT